MIEFSIILAILFILTLFEFFDKNRTQINSKYYLYSYIITIFFLMLFCGLRVIGIDRDSYMYSIYFEMLKGMTLSQSFFENNERFEIGYVFFNKIFAGIGFTAMLLFISLITVGIKGYVFFKYSAMPFFSTFIYFCMFFILREFTQLRDALSVTFLILSILLYYQNKKWVSFLMFLLAFSFHIIAIVYLPIIIFLHYFKDKRYYYFLLVSGLIVYFFNPLHYILQFEFFPKRILNYNQIKGGGSLSVIIIGIMALVCYEVFESSKIQSAKGLEDFYFKLTILAIFSGLVTIHHPVLSRISNFLMFFAILLLSNKLSSREYKFQTVIFLILLSFSSFFFIKGLNEGLIDFSLGCNTKNHLLQTYF